MTNQKGSTTNQISKNDKRSLNSINIEERGTQFYHYEVIKYLKPYKLSSKPAIVLIIMRKLIDISFMNQQWPSQQLYRDELQYVNQEQRVDSIFQYLKYSQLVYFFSDYFIKDTVELAFILIIFLLNISLGLFMAVKYLCFIAKKEDILQSFQTMIQFLITIYNYGLFHISLGLSLQIVNQNGDNENFEFVIACLNIIGTLIIGFLVEIHDFSYSFDGSSKLAKTDLASNLILFLFSAGLVFLNQFTSQAVIYGFSTLYFGVQFIATYKYDQYYNQNINQLSFSLNLSSLIIAICLLHQVFFSTNSDIIFICVVAIPLAVKIAIKIKQNQNHVQLESFFVQENLPEYSSNVFMKIIRAIQIEGQECQNHYMFKGQGIIYENIMHMHRIHCKLVIGHCFCSKNITNNTDGALQIEELTEQHSRKDFIQNTLLQFMQDYISQAEKRKNNKDIISLKLTLINYIHEIIQDPTKTCIELNKFYYQSVKPKKIQGTHLFYFYQLKDTLRQQYQDFFDDSNLENQRINMMGSIVFNEKMIQCRDKLRNQLLNIGIFYDQLCCDFINLKFMEMQSSSLQKSNLQLQETFIQLYQINPFNIDLQYLTSIYVQILDIDNRKISDFQKLGLNNYKLSKKGLKLIKDQYINQQNDYFSERSCVVYTSLVDSEYQVKKVSVQFERIFKINKDSIIGKPINILIPRIVKESHNKMIENFTTKESTKIIAQGEKPAFGVDNKGFVFAITFRLKLEYSLYDIGICALIQKLYQQKQYILFTDDGKVTDFSKKLYLDLYQTLDFKKDFIEDIYSLVPITQNIVQGCLYDTQFCSTLIVQKRNSMNVDKNNTIASSIQNKVIQRIYSYNDEIFLLKFKVSRIQTQINVNINFLEIDQYEKETQEIQKKRIINEINETRNIIQQYSNNYQIQQQQNNLNNKHLSEKQLSQQSFDFGYRKRKGYDSETNYEIDNINSLFTLQSPSKIERKTIFRPNQKIQQQKNDATLNMIPFQSQKNDSLRILEQQNSIVSNGELLSHQNENSQHQIIDISKFDNRLSMKNLDSPDKRRGMPKHFSYHINNQSMNESNQMIMQRNPNFKSQEELTYVYNSSAISKINIFDFPQTIYEQQDNLMKQDILDSNRQLQQQQQQDSTFVKTNRYSNRFKDDDGNYDNDDENISVSQDEQIGSYQMYPKNKINNYDSDVSNNDKDEDVKADQHNEIASVNSSKFSSVELNKRSMIRKIKKGNISRGQYFMILTGVSAFLILLTVTMLMHQKNIESLNQYQKSFSQIDHALYLFVDVMDVMSLSNYNDLLGSKHYGKYFGTNIERKNEKNEVKTISYDLVREDYRYQFQQLVLKSYDEQILKKLEEEKFPILKYTSVIVDDSYMNEYMDQNLQYTIMEYFYAIVQYIIQFTSIEEGFIWDNIETFKAKTKELQMIVQNVAITQFNNMEAAQTFIIVIISVINLILTLTIIPLSIFVQFQKENILKLSGSFQPSILERQIKVIEYGLLKIESFMIGKDIQSNKSLDLQSLKHTQYYNPRKGQLKAITDQVEELKQMDDQLANKSGKLNKAINSDLPQFIVRLPNKRNRSIASFSNLPKFSSTIFFSSMIAIILLLIQPFVNIIITKSYLKESEVLLNERITLLDISSQLVENQSPHYANLYMSVLLDYSPNDTYYFQYLTNMTNPNSLITQKIPTLSKTLNIKRYKQDRFDGFYLTILHGNLCEVKEKYSFYFNSNITKEECENIFDGILQRGLILSLKSAFFTFSQLYEVYQASDFETTFISFMEKYPLIKINTFIKLITQSINSIRSYQNQQSNEHYQQIYNQLTLLFIIQLLIITAIFFFGWTYLFKLFNKQLAESKNILTLFHINILFENTFIVSHLKKSHIG